MHEKGYGPAAIEQACPHCVTRELHDPRADGEIVRGSQCRECDEWYTVHDYTEKGDM